MSMWISVSRVRFLPYHLWTPQVLVLTALAWLRLTGSNQNAETPRFAANRGLIHKAAKRQQNLRFASLKTRGSRYLGNKKSTAVWGMMSVRHAQTGKTRKRRPSAQASSSCAGVTKLRAPTCSKMHALTTSFPASDLKSSPIGRSRACH